MNEPLVSVITVVYNNHQTIQSTIESVVSQSYTNFEYIIIDGGSTDGTLAIVESYKERIATFISEKDNGIYHAMNKGIKLSKGRFCIFLNSGDYFENGHVLESFSTQLIHSGSDIVYGDVVTLSNTGQKTYITAAEPCNKHRMYFCHQSAFIKSSWMKKFLYDEKYKMSSDFKFFKICYYHQLKFTHIKQPVAIYNMAGVSNTNRIAGLKENIQIIIETDKGFELLKHLFRILPSFIMKAISNYFKKLKSKSS